VKAVVQDKPALAVPQQSVPQQSVPQPEVKPEKLQYTNDVNINYIL
jgi:hypothetical protein